MEKEINSIRFLLFALVLMTGITACKPQKHTSKKDLNISGNSLVSFDWEGTYLGTVPCADCDGIKTQLTLNKDFTFILKTQYPGKSDSVYQREGKFSCDKSGSHVILDDAGKRQFKLEENRLVQLNTTGHRISGDLAPEYILEKVKIRLTGVYWKMVTFNGKHVSPAPKEPHIIFEAEYNRAHGSGGCNQFSCGYETKEDSKIKFDTVLSTKMACIGQWNENDFFSALGKVSFYELKENRLILKDENETTLAVFEPDFFKK